MCTTIGGASNVNTINNLRTNSCNPPFQHRMIPQVVRPDFAPPRGEFLRITDAAELGMHPPDAPATENGRKHNGSGQRPAPDFVNPDCDTFFHLLY